MTIYDNLTNDQKIQMRIAALQCATDLFVEDPKRKPVTELAEDLYNWQIKIFAMEGQPPARPRKRSWL